MKALKPPFIFSIEYQESRCPKHRMSCGQKEHPHLTTCVCGGSPAETKVFNPNIGKLYPKTVSCHLFGYIEKSKGFRFYCPERYTKFVETRHAVFLEDEKMRGSMVAREIDLEVKRVYAPTLMIHEPIFSLHAVAAPTV